MKNVLLTKFIDNCKAEVKLPNIDIEKVKKFGNAYCLSEKNHVNCERYKLYKTGKDVPEELAPDGSNN